MTYFVQTPYRANIANRAPYPKYLDVIDGDPTAVQRQLRRRGSGGYETDMQATLLSVCEWLGEGCVFYDIGAHVGYYSAMVETMFRSAQVKVIAFDPTPQTAKIASLIREANGLSYDFIEAAVSDTPGSVNLYLSPKAETSNSLNSEFRDGSLPITVRATTIDEYISSGGLKPNFIKIDVETFEHAVLSGGMGSIAQYRPCLTCEMLNSGASFEPMQAVLGQLEEFGYKFYRISADAEWQAWPAADVEQHLDPRLRDWLFLPDEMTSELRALISEWRKSLQDCGRETNVNGRARTGLWGFVKDLKIQKLRQKVWS